MSAVYVLDSYALLAYLRAEPGGVRVRELLEAAGAGAALLLVSLVSYGEVAYNAERRAGSRAARTALAVLDQLPIDVVAPDQAITLAAAHLKATRQLSYADAFAAALARDHGATVVTGDPEFRSVEGLIAVDWLA